MPSSSPEGFLSQLTIEEQRRTFAQQSHAVENGADGSAGAKLAHEKPRGISDSEQADASFAEQRHLHRLACMEIVDTGRLPQRVKMFRGCFGFGLPHLLEIDPGLRWSAGKIGAPRIAGGAGATGLLLCCTSSR
jgi:hypothetical protein